MRPRTPTIPPTQDGTREMNDQTTTEPIKGDPTDRTGPEPWKSWEEYATSYNLRTMPGLSALFTRFLIEECRKRDGDVVALDVGCGHGIGGKLERSRQARAHMKELWGIEPDTGVPEPEGIFDRAAVRAVSKWKFKPRIVDGQPVAARAEQVVEFRLNE